MSLRPFLMVRWIVEGLTDDCAPAVIFAESAYEAKMLASYELRVQQVVSVGLAGRVIEGRVTTSKDWDARELRTRAAMRTAKMLSRGSSS